MLKDTVQSTEMNPSLLYSLNQSFNRRKTSIKQLANKCHKMLHLPQESHSMTINSVVKRRNPGKHFSKIVAQYYIFIFLFLLKSYYNSQT